MNQQQVQEYLKRLYSIVDHFEGISEPEVIPIYDDYGEYIESQKSGRRTVENSSDAYALIARIANVIQEICPRNSTYVRHVEMATGSLFDDLFSNPTIIVDRLIALVKALIQDIDGGYLTSVSELIHGEVLTDYLDMAQHLLSEGYKDAAAVIAGGTLESHLRQLCIKHNIDLEEPKSGKNTKPKSVSNLNIELRKAGIYSLYEQKMVTARLDVRNNAAHGKYDAYSLGTVQEFIEWLLDFIAKNPA